MKKYGDKITDILFVLGLCYALRGLFDIPWSKIGYLFLSIQLLLVIVLNHIALVKFGESINLFSGKQR